MAPRPYLYHQCVIALSQRAVLVLRVPELDISEQVSTYMGDLDGSTNATHLLT